jgi:hypothetical protein
VTLFDVAPLRGSRPVETSSGEIEHERLSRRANAAEAFIVYLLIQATLWSGLGLPARPGEIPGMRVMGLTLAGLVAFYILVIAPWVHDDGWHGRGLSRPLELFALWPQRGRAFRLGAMLLVLAIPALLLGVGWNSLLIRLGIRLTWPDLYGQLTVTPWRQIGTAAMAVAVVPVLAGFLIRWTNLGSAARSLAWPMGLALVGIMAAAALAAAGSGDWARFSEFAWTGRRGNALFPRLAAYVPWALLQQWFLLSYLNTRIRKAVPKSGWAGLSGRAVTAGLTGIAFGALHWPNAPLVIFTCLGGYISGWLFQQDRCRNLFLLGLAHALAGALVAILTSVRMGIGPRL